MCTCWHPPSGAACSYGPLILVCGEKDRGVRASAGDARASSPLQSFSTESQRDLARLRLAARNRKSSPSDLAPVYNIDVTVGSPVKDFELDGEPWRLSANATFKTADRRDADPDSYLLSAKVGRIFPANLGNAGPFMDFQWDVIRAEFSRKEESSNIVTAPVLTLSNRLFAVLREDKTPKAAMDMDLLGGLELGRNLQDKIVPEGYGGIVRVVPGMALYAVFPGGLGLNEVRWTTTYRARILLKREPFTDVRDDDSPFPSVAKGTRHEWKDELTFKVNSLVSFTLTHDYGSVPPAFKILDHRVSLGATAMWAWKK